MADRDPAPGPAAVPRERPRPALAALLGAALVLVPLLLGVLVPHAVVGWPAHGGCGAGADVMADNDRLEAWGTPLSGLAALLAVGIGVGWWRALPAPVERTAVAGVTGLFGAAGVAAAALTVGLVPTQGELSLVLVPAVVGAVAVVVAHVRTASDVARWAAILAAVVTCWCALVSGASWDFILSC